VPHPRGFKRVRFFPSATMIDPPNTNRWPSHVGAQHAAPHVRKISTLEGFSLRRLYFFTSLLRLPA
jgi:hypothetical protein